MRSCCDMADAFHFAAAIADPCADDVHHLQGLELDGHKLLIQLSQRKRLADDGGKAGKATKGGKANTTKLVRIVWTSFCASMGHCELQPLWHLSPRALKSHHASSATVAAPLGLDTLQVLWPFWPAITSSSESCPVSVEQVVRNVAFEATRKDLVGLFGPFGHIKSARLPRKFDGNHR
jgi:RNA recognition motif. (a.k.a. RRM, RBD, or RNP domain)